MDKDDVVKCFTNVDIDGEVDDVVTTSKEFEALQKKYGNYGISVTSVNPYLFGMNTDNITITNA